MLPHHPLHSRNTQRSFSIILSSFILVIFTVTRLNTSIKRLRIQLKCMVKVNISTSRLLPWIHPMDLVIINWLFCLLIRKQCVCVSIDIAGLSLVRHQCQVRLETWKYSSRTMRKNWQQVELDWITLLIRKVCWM